MNDFLLDVLLDLKPYENLLKDIDDGVTPISVHGLIEENLGHFCAAINKHTARQLLLVTYDESRARQLYEDIRGMLGEDRVVMFPRKEMIFYDIDAYSREKTYQRLKVLSKLIKDEKLIIISSVDAVSDRLPSKHIFEGLRLKIEIGKDYSLDSLSELLIRSGYERVNMVEAQGQFSIRGGILDIFSPDMSNPVRIEFFDLMVDSIRTFDFTTQKSIEVIESVVIEPSQEIPLSVESDVIADRLQADLALFEKAEKGSEAAAKAEEKFTRYEEYLRQGVHIPNRDLLLPYFSENDSSDIFSFLSSEALLLFDEPRRIEESARLSAENFDGRASDLFEAGEILSSHFLLKLRFDDIVERSQKSMCLTSAVFLKQDANFPPKAIHQFSSRQMAVYHGKIDILKDDIERLRYRGYKTIILSGDEDRGKRLVETLDKMDIASELHYDRELRISTGQLFITPGSVRSGFEYEGVKLAVISDKDIFGVGKSRTKKRKDKLPKKESSLSFGDLKEGDFVVHENYGIGQYLGIKQLSVQGIKKDYLLIQYKGNDRLYLPVEQMVMIQKYIGADSAKPKVNRLSGGEWIRTKSRTRKAIEDMAEELLELYAKREKLKGYEFSRDTAWQSEFEDMFPYEETDGQLVSSAEIKEDMEKPRPMDRLLCGDVGYGKTEVALRAAFKAIMDGKQVAILVPTTILAQQHYNTLSDRFGTFPVKIAMLSRFRSQKEQKESVRLIEKGAIDIVVGTHRLLSKDVKFKDLGLLIVDEEQRFGVRHKESLKKLKESVDVLTLTATPIPRTLHMSLVGIRDMSVIEDPPEERFPIQTYVTEYNKSLIREAILKEISRGGQVYYVYNRVETIDKVAIELQELIPEAVFAIGHGQMTERELEKTMMDFLNKESDVLICTTIIETGLDIPNVNTIIIHDADKMGLSQLYQLRGRVGRSNRIAYSYFTYEKDKVLSEVAEKRLRAIREFTEFGSGFKIAMRDLEIRGAGNLLGMEQHGHIETIGYDLYVKYLGEAVRKLKGDVVDERLDTQMDIDVDGFIESRYIEDEEQKIEIYQKISSIESMFDYREVIDELIDRFGDLPKPVENLMNISYIRALASKNGIKSIFQRNSKIVLEYADTRFLVPELIGQLSGRYGKEIEFDLSNKPEISVAVKGDILNRLRELIELIDNFGAQ